MKTLLIFFLLAFSVFSNAQTWEREYGIQNRREKIFASSNSYDGGFALGLRINDNKVLIIKTNINGYILWRKLFYHTQRISIQGLDASENGDIIFTGMFQGFDEQGDPFILKIDSCGNQAWCKVAQMTDGNYGRRVLFSNDGSIIWHTYGDEDNYNLNHLWKIDNEGFAIWKRNIASRYNYPLIHSPLFENFHETPDHGHIFAGSCYYPKDTNYPTGNYVLRSFVIKTDSSGDEEWILPAGYSEDIIGKVDDIVELNNKYYAVGYRYDTSLLFTSPLFLKISKEGSMLHHAVINQGDTLENYLVGITNINDSSLIITGRTRRGEEDSLKMGIFKTDTLGNIITWMENNNGSPINQCLVKTNDNKYLITGYTVHSGNYDGYAVKVNENIEFDSIYTHPFVYDSLCPDSIVSDTIFCDCDILVNQEEIKRPKENSAIKIYPNPTKSIFNISIPGLNENKFTNSTCIIEIFDIYGRKVKEIKVPKGQKEIEVDVSGWRKGLYLVRVRTGQNVVGSVKVVVN